MQSKRRGRIPQSAWPDILRRHEQGESLSSIARDFDCTPSAISYVIKKNQAGAGTADAEASESDEEMTNENEPETGTEVTGEAPVTAEEAPRTEEARPRTRMLRMKPAAPAPVAVADTAGDNEGGDHGDDGQASAAPRQATDIRVEETAATCRAAYATWRSAPSPETLDALQTSLHEIRKVIARVEIEIAAARGSEPIQRPAQRHVYRAARR
jgi:transposase-like protein